MATRSEQYRAQAQRHPSKQSKKKAANHAAKNSRVKRKVAARENVRAGKKATTALEPRPANGARPSRKSTRASANRMKYDTNIELRQDRRKRSPESRYRSGK